MMKIEDLAVVVNTRPAPLLLAYKQPKPKGLPKGARGAKARGHQVKPGRNDIGDNLGQLPREVWEQCRKDKSVQMQLDRGIITELSAEQEVPRQFDAGKTTLDMSVQEAQTHIADLGSVKDFSLLNDVFQNDARPEVRAAVESRLSELAVQQGA